MRQGTKIWQWNFHIQRKQKNKTYGMVKNPFCQEQITSLLNVQPWPLSSTQDSQETTSGQSSALSDQELTKHDYHKFT